MAKIARANLSPGNHGRFYRLPSLYPLLSRPRRDSLDEKSHGLSPYPPPFHKFHPTRPLRNPSRPLKRPRQPRHQQSRRKFHHLHPACLSCLLNF